MVHWSSDTDWNKIYIYYIKTNFRLVDTDHKITMDLEWKTPSKTFGELKAYRVRYGRINQQQLTDILITDPNVHHQEISGLEKGIEYEFRVAGVNTVGPGQESIKYYLTPEGEMRILEIVGARSRQTLAKIYFLFPPVCWK